MQCHSEGGSLSGLSLWLSPLLVLKDGSPGPTGWGNCVFCASFLSLLWALQSSEGGWRVAVCWHESLVTVCLCRWYTAIFGSASSSSLSTASQCGLRKPLSSGGWVWKSFLILWQRQMCLMEAVSGFTGDINGTVTSSVSMGRQNKKKKCLYSNMSGKFIFSPSLKQTAEEIYY